MINMKKDSVEKRVKTRKLHWELGMWGEVIREKWVEIQSTFNVNKCLTIYNQWFYIFVDEKIIFLFLLLFLFLSMPAEFATVTSLGLIDLKKQ